MQYRAMPEAQLRAHLLTATGGALRIADQFQGRNTASDKTNHKGEADVVTNADLNAQRHYVEYIGRHFPGYGMIGEEDGLHTPCQFDNATAYFTIDPIDGTKNYAAGEAFGVASLLALVVDQRITAVAIGDAISGSHYYYTPGSGGVVHLRRNGHTINLNTIRPRPLAESTLLLRYPPSFYDSWVQKLVQPHTRFGRWEIAGGSIALNLARLWCGQVGAVARTRSHTTPWDDTPIQGIHEKLDIVTLYQDNNGLIREYHPPLVTKPAPFGMSLFYIHRSQVDEFRRMF